MGCYSREPQGIPQNPTTCTFYLRIAKYTKKVQDMDAASAHPRVAALSKDYRLVGIQRILFHSLASMALPAATIQGVMKCTSWMMKDIKNTRLRTTGTLGLGLSVIPFCPYIFDKPVAKALDWAFNKAL